MGKPWGKLQNKGREICPQESIPFFSHGLGVYAKQDKLAAAQILRLVVEGNADSNLLNEHIGALTCGKLGDIYYQLWSESPNHYSLPDNIYRISDYLTGRRRLF